MSPWNGFPGDDVDSSVMIDGLSYDSDLESQVSTVPVVTVERPRETFDPNFSGPVVNTKLRCFHGDFPERKVAFDVAATGRKFIGCSRNGPGRCNFLVWIDEPWNPELSRALIHLWNLIGLPYSGELAIGEGSISIGKPYIDTLVEKTQLEQTLQIIQKDARSKEQMFKELIRSIRKKNSRTTRAYAILCASAVSVAATLAAVVVIMAAK